MERMFDNYTFEEVLDGFKEVNEIVVRLKKEKMGLEEENKKLEADSYNELQRLCLENYELREENKKLKSDLSECECSFGFESDEVGYRKREYKRLKKWIKDHCKGYGNLFPEDEMKRQWKKADKKRK